MTTPSTEMEQKCATCKYWLTYVTANTGKCRRLPPQKVSYVETKEACQRVCIETYTVTEFPETLAYEWCGEWQGTGSVTPVLLRNSIFSGNEPLDNIPQAKY